MEINKDTNGRCVSFHKGQCESNSSRKTDHASQERDDAEKKMIKGIEGTRTDSSADGEGVRSNFWMRCGRDLLAFQPWSRDAESLKWKKFKFGGKPGPGGFSVWCWGLGFEAASGGPWSERFFQAQFSWRHDGKSAEHHVVHASSPNAKRSLHAHTWLAAGGGLGLQAVSSLRYSVTGM